MSETYDAVIVGAGIVGCACAFYLCQDFKKVAVIDKGPIGGGVTAAPMGHVTVMDDSEAQFALTKYSQDLWEELYAEIPADCEMERCGAQWVASDDEEMDQVRKKHEFYKARGVATEILDALELREAEPNLRPDLVGSLSVPGDSVIFPMTAAKWLAGKAKGVQFLLGQTVAELKGRSVILTNGGRIEAALTINASGPYAQELTPGLPIQLRKGHLVITDRYPGFVRSQLIELGYLKSANSNDPDSVAFNVQPRATGQLLIGSSRQFVGWSGEIDRRILGRMLKRALHFMPGLAALSAIRTWTGFRPACSTHLPLIGPWPEEPGLYVAAGHEGLGVTTSMGTGRLLADMIAGRAPKIDVSPYLPKRFANV